MISLKNLYKEVSRLYRSALEDAGVRADILEEDLSAPIIRPSGKVELEDSRKTRLLYSGAEQEVIFRLYYFATDRRYPKLENLTVQHAIGERFLDGIIVDDTYLGIDEGVQFTETDGVLVATIDLKWAEPIHEPEGELMENLNFHKEGTRE